jgi:hypothetical protein
VKRGERRKERKMSDEQVSSENASANASERVEVQAKELGWQPKEDFRGDPKNWVPAEEYVKRGETVLPYMQADRKRLFKKVDEQSAEIEGLRADLSASRESIETLKQFTASDALKKKDDEIVSLRRQLVEARRGGDVDAEVKLEGQLDTAKDERESLASDAKGSKTPESARDPVRERIAGLTRTPEWKSFIRDNPWYEEDSVARAAATAISGEIMQDPENKGLSFADKLALVAEQTKARLGIGEPVARARGKVEGSRGGGNGGGRASTGPSYENLSSEAKAVCDRQAKSVVGPKRAYKTVEEWQKAYAKMVS